jgi:hypothetical protein
VLLRLCTKSPEDVEPSELLSLTFLSWTYNYGDGRDVRSIVEGVKLLLAVANYFTVNLTLLKEVSQALADLFGLTLPVSWKMQAHTMAGDQLGPEPHFLTSRGELVGTSS